MANKYIPSSIKEYGAASYIICDNRDIIYNLKKYFPNYNSEIFVLSVVRFLFNSPLKNIRLHYADSWLSEKFLDTRLFSHLMEIPGHRREAIINFLKEFIEGEENLLIDLTRIFSKSRGVSLAQKGYNTDFEFSPQLNILFIFSQDKKLPLFYRILSGSIRYVSSMAQIIEEAGITAASIIADKGFYSGANIDLLEKNNLKYIIPPPKKK